MSLVKTHKISTLAMLLCAGLLALSGCSSMPQNGGSGAQTDEDPLEGFNRVMYKINYGLDVVIIRPVTVGYRFVVPETGRKMVTNFLDNLYSPVVFINSVAQTDPQNSFATLWRFILNSTFGLGGLFDFASTVGLHNRPADFGETMAIYGVDSGPFLFLPFVGPSNFRDGAGLAVDGFLFPVDYAANWIWISDWAATVVDARSNNMNVIDNIYRDSLDPYSTFKSAYNQKRASDIRKAKASRKKALEQARAHSCSPGDQTPPPPTKLLTSK